MPEVVFFDPSLQADTADLNSLAAWEKHNTSVTTNLQIQSGVIIYPDGPPDNEAASQLTAAHNADQYCEIKFGGTKNGATFGVIVSGQAPNTTEDFFMLSAQFTSESSATMRYAKKIAGAYTAFGGDTLTLASGDILRITRRGDLIYFAVNGELKFTGDNSGTPGELPGGSPGIFIGDSATGTISEVRSGNVLSALSLSKSSTQFGNKTHDTGQAVSVPMQDDLGNPMFTSSGTITRYGAVGLPPGITINESTGEMSGTPTTVGTYGVTVFADDSNGWQDGTTFTWTINQGAAPGPSITSTTDPTVDGVESSITSSGLAGTPTTTLGGYSITTAGTLPNLTYTLDIASITADGPVSVPRIGDSLTLSVTGNEGTATSTVATSPATGYATVTLAGTLATETDGLIDKIQTQIEINTGLTVTVAVGDILYYPTADSTSISTTGVLTTDSESFNMVLIQGGNATTAGNGYGLTVVPPTAENELSVGFIKKMSALKMNTRKMTAGKMKARKLSG